MQCVTTAGREAEQNQLRMRMSGANDSDKIRKVVVELTGKVDIAAHPGPAVAANVGSVDCDPLRAQRLCQRMQAGTRSRRTVDADDDQRRIGHRRVFAPDAEGDWRAVVRRDCFDRRQIAEVNALERLADRRQRWRRLAGPERNHRTQGDHDADHEAAHDERKYPQYRRIFLSHLPIEGLNLN